MIKIIKPGYLKEIQCSKCGAVLSYDENEDVETRYEKRHCFNHGNLSETCKVSHLSAV